MPPQSQQQIVQNQQGNRVIQKREVEVEDNSQTGLSTGTWFLMLGVALFFDATGALCNLIPPPAGQIIEELNDAFADGVFWLTFKIQGLKSSNGTMFGAFILKFIPALNIIPEYTLMIIIMYFREKGKEKIAKVPGGQVMASAAFAGSRNPNSKTPPPLSKSASKNMPQRNPNNSPLRSQREYTPGVADIPKRPSDNGDLRAQGDTGRKVIDFEGAKKRLETYKQENNTDDLQKAA